MDLSKYPLGYIHRMTLTSL